MNENITAIYERFSVPIYKFARRLCGDEVIAQDIVSETFTRLVEKLAVGKGPQTNTRSYLYQTAYHLFIDHARDSRRYAPLEVAENAVDDKAGLPEERVQKRAAIRQVIGLAKTRLSSDQRAVVALRLVEGFSLKASAQILGRRVNDIKAIQYRATVILRKGVG